MPERNSMYRRIVFGLLVAVCAAPVVLGAPAPPFPNGTFAREVIRLVLSPGGAFGVKLDGKSVVNGHYQVKDGQVIFTDAGGHMACPSDIEGRYKWTFRGQTARLSGAR
jgi:hypothetical protein